MTPIPEPDISHNGACWDSPPDIGVAPRLRCELKAGHRGAHEAAQEYGTARWTNFADRGAQAMSDEGFDKATWQKEHEPPARVADAWDELFGISHKQREAWDEAIGRKFDEAAAKVKERVNATIARALEAGDFKVDPKPPTEEDPKTMLEKVQEVLAKHRDERAMWQRFAEYELKRQGGITYRSPIAGGFTSNTWAARIPDAYFSPPLNLDLFLAEREKDIRDLAAQTKMPRHFYTESGVTTKKETEMKTHKIFDTTDDNGDYVQLRRAAHDPSLLNLRARDIDDDAFVYLDPAKVREALDDLFPAPKPDTSKPIRGDVYIAPVGTPVHLLHTDGSVTPFNHIHWGFDGTRDDEPRLYDAGGEVPASTPTTNDAEKPEPVLGSDAWLKNAPTPPVIFDADLETMRLAAGMPRQRPDVTIDLQRTRIAQLEEALRRERIAHGEQKSRAIQLEKKLEDAKKMNVGLQVGIQRAKEDAAEKHRSWVAEKTEAQRLGALHNKATEREVALRQGVVKAQQERDLIQRHLVDAVDRNRRLHARVATTRNYLASAERDRNAARAQRDVAVETKQKYGTALDEANERIERLKHDLEVIPGVGAKHGEPRYATDVSIDGRKLLVDGRELPWHIQDGPTIELVTPSSGEDPQMSVLRIGIFVEGPIQIS